MKKIKIKHRMNKKVKDALKLMNQYTVRRTTNNYRKMHGKPMRRKAECIIRCKI